jgi:nickel superoxide dismutase
MKLFWAAVLGSLTLCGASALRAMPAAAPRAPAAVLRHCQVPCGIYGDRMRVAMLLENATTIEKAMNQIRELEDGKNYNQIVRWVTTKDEHAQGIQQMCLDYWLAQRIKAPADGAGEDAIHTYGTQLALMHEIIVAAMKCKQTTDTANVEKIRDAAMKFSETYFSEEDLEHLKAHHDD